MWSEVAARQRAGVGQPAARQVVQPQLQFLQAGRHFLFPGGQALGLGGGVHRLGGLLGLGLLLLGGGLRLLQPFRHPAGGLGGFEQGETLGVAQHQRQAVLAGLLAAGAGAFEAEGIQVEGGAVDGAALDFAPQDGVVDAEVLPLAGLGQLAGVLGGAVVGSELQRLLGGQSGVACVHFLYLFRGTGSPVRFEPDDSMEEQALGSGPPLIPSVR